MKKPPAAGMLFDVDSGRGALAAAPASARAADREPDEDDDRAAHHRAHGPSERVPISRKRRSHRGLRHRRAARGQGGAARGADPGADHGLRATTRRSPSPSTTPAPSPVRRPDEPAGARRWASAAPTSPTPNGLKDRGNHSCAARPRGAGASRPGRPADRPDRQDHLGHARLSRSRAASSTSPTTTTSSTTGSPGVPAAQVTGLKTGFTDGAGRCYVTTARLGGAPPRRRPARLARSAPPGSEAARRRLRGRGLRLSSSRSSLAT